MPTTTEERTARVEGILEQMDKRLTNIEGEIVRINHQFEQVNNRIDQKFNWLMGIMITMWISLIITMLFK
jgi:tetrahydromethanopterin S-methyltransferase subunit G